VRGVATIAGQIEKLKSASSVIVSVSTISGSVIRLKNVVSLVSGVTSTVGNVSKVAQTDTVIIQGVATATAESRTFIDAIASIQGLGNIDADAISFNYDFFRDNYNRQRTVFVRASSGLTSAQRRVLIPFENRVVKIQSVPNTSAFRRLQIRAR
jgi:predicted phage gp36 major capsid-like protein